MGRTHDSNLVIAPRLLSSLSLTWNQAIIWDQVLYMNTSSRDLNVDHQGKKIIKVKLL